MTLGADLANEIAAALIEGASSVGNGPLFSTFRRAGTGPTSPHDETAVGSPTYFELSGVSDEKEVRDATGTLTGVIRRTLTLNATGTEPLKSDSVAVGVAQADVDGDTVWSEILEVRTLAPGGVALLYEVDLVR